jgi:hypothetical protein
LRHNRLISAILMSTVWGLSLAFHSRQAEAAIIGKETPDTLSLSFSRSDSYPPGNSPFANGPLVSLFSGQYWQVSVRSSAAPTGPAAGNSALFVQQVIPGQTAVPNAVFGLSLRNFVPYTNQASYLANSPAQNYGQVNCPLSSPNCVFYQLQLVQDPNATFTSLSYQLQGSFQTALPPVPISEASTGVSAFAALGLMAVLQIKKRLFTKSYAE